MRSPATQTVDPTNVVTGLGGSGNYVQVGRNALPLFNAGLVGTARHTTYLRSDPMKDVTRFGADILYPVLVRDLQALGDRLRPIERLLRDARRGEADGGVHRHAGDQDALAVENAHGVPFGGGR